MNTDEELREIAEELRIRSNCAGFEDCTGCQALSTKLFGDRFVCASWMIETRVIGEPSPT